VRFSIRFRGFPVYFYYQFQRRRFAMRFPFPLRFFEPDRRREPAPTYADPIDHPAIAAMSLSELADLPIWRAGEAENAKPDFRAGAKRETCGIR
jgi:hypothetical protein